jgi:hypothetical protein
MGRMACSPPVEAALAPLLPFVDQLREAMAAAEPKLREFALGMVRTQEPSGSAFQLERNGERVRR